MGPVRAARVLGTSRLATWLDVEDRVLVIANPGAVRLPNAVSIPEGLSVSRFVRVGDGRVGVEGRRTIDAVRWWDPVPVLSRVDRLALREAMSSATGWLPPFHRSTLSTALAARDSEGVLAAADALLGRGLGLTPEGDDVLAAALASYRHIGAALADDSAPGTVDAIAERLIVTAETRTTSLSASLLRHAVAGAVAEPVAALLRALTGRGDVGVALQRLSNVGHSSGRALADGVLLGAAAAARFES